MRFWLLLLAVSVALAGDVSTPAIGFARSATGDIWRVSGIAGAFVTESTELNGAVSAGFSTALGIVKFGDTVRVLNANGELVNESSAPAGAALIGFNAKGDTAAVYYEAAQTLTLWRDGEWRDVPFSGDVGRVAAVAIGDSGSVLVAVAGDRLSVVSVRVSDGAIESMSGAGGAPAGPVLLMPDRTLLIERDGALFVRDRNGSGQQVPLDAEALSHMGNGWVQARTASGRHVALRLANQVQIFELPEAQ